MANVNMRPKVVGIKNSYKHFRINGTSDL